jgi:hypothetical protein
MKKQLNTGSGIPLVVGFSLFYFLCLCPNSRLHAASLSEDCASFAGKPVPKFSIEKTMRGDRGPALIVYINISKKDIEREKIVTLACALGQEHSTEQAFVAWIFDNAKAAKSYNPQGEGNSKETVRSLVASYGFSKDTGQHFHSLRLYITNGDDRSVTEIELREMPGASEKVRE